MLMNIPLAAADFHAFSARYGEDELCLVVIGSSHRPEEVADRLREHLVEIQTGQELSKGYTVTVSIGHIVRHTPDYSSDDLISRADFYQYQGKRNCHRANEKQPFPSRFAVFRETPVLQCLFPGRAAQTSPVAFVL